MPDGDVHWLNPADILSFEEIADVVESATRLGINKIRLTGGEPLVRKDIARLVGMIAAIKEVKDLALTTNGILLGELAGELKAAGLMRVNVSLDTLDPLKFKSLTRGGNIRQVFDGIQAAMEAGLEPVKINCVVSGSSDEEDARQVKEYALLKGLRVRFIRQMDLETGEFGMVEGGEGGNCSICNRLRLTANGMVKPCLFSEQEYPVREMGAEKALIAALESKPLKGCVNRIGKFYNIGG